MKNKEEYTHSLKELDNKLENDNKHQYNSWDYNHSHIFNESYDWKENKNER